VAIFPTLYDQFPAPPAQHFRGRCVVVQGRVELYRGTPQLVVQTADDIRVVEGE
jgi:DNA/RNA endonuclease YhcR with UshA esterase domain